MAISFVVVLAAIAYSYFRSLDLSTQFEEIAETVSKKCETRTETQGCSASGPIISAPYFINSVIQGYRVYPGEDPDLFDSTGLKFGDLVTAVEGQPLTNVELANQLLEKLINGQTIRVTVDRDGAIKEIELLSD